MRTALLVLLLVGTALAATPGRVDHVVRLGCGGRTGEHVVEVRAGR
jgi:hypothetical protein